MPAAFVIFVGISKIYYTLNNFMNILKFYVLKWQKIFQPTQCVMGKKGEYVCKSESFVSWKILFSAKSVILCQSWSLGRSKITFQVIITSPPSLFQEELGSRLDVFFKDCKVRCSTRFTV
jgi:hypothetical protein